MKKRKTAMRSKGVTRGRSPNLLGRTTGSCITAGLVLASGGAVNAQQAEPVNEAAPSVLQEIVVTAQHRSESVQDIPYNISVVGGEDLARSSALSLSDLTRTVNGLVSVDQGMGARANQNNLTLRGIRTDNPGGGVVDAYVPNLTVNPVSTYFGDTPIFFPMAMQDIQRVEVLRGPQGTLYGSGAEAGTIRVIPNAPDFRALSGQISVTGSRTQNAPNNNYSSHGVLNIPLSDTLAVRVAAGKEHLAGFIDAVNLWELGPNRIPVSVDPADPLSPPVILPRQRGVNSSDQYYGRVAARWAPTSLFDATLTYLHQHTSSDHAQEVVPGWPGGCTTLSGDVPGTLIPCAGAPAGAFNTSGGNRYTTTAFQTQPYRDTVDLISLVANIDFGFAKLTSVSSYDKDAALTETDATWQSVNVGGFSFLAYPPYVGFPRFLAYDTVPTTEKSFVQELRLVSNGKNRVDYVLGAFFQQDKTDMNFTSVFPGLIEYNAAIGTPINPTFGDISVLSTRNTKFTDKALFGELTYHVSDAWQATGGLRVFKQHFSNDFSSAFPFCGAFCSPDLTDPRGYDAGGSTQESSRALWKLNTSYDVGDNTKIYATFSEGFRRGGANAVNLLGPFATLPQFQKFTPDSAKNYEIGIKGTLAQRRVRYSAAVYRIDLENFQFNSQNLSGYNAVFNGGSARSKGVELELQAVATERMTLSFGYTYTDAFTTAAVAKEDIVPYALVPEFGGTGPTDTAPLFNIPSGARLPGVPHHTATAGIDYAVRALFRSNMKLNLHADGSYRSSENSAIDVTSRFYTIIPSSVLVNAKASLDINDHLSADLFVTNLTNDEGYSGVAFAQNVAHPYQLKTVTRPRTVGLSFRLMY